jgi:septal ring factor EnvC (AmiA/AmiB activator)
VLLVCASLAAAAPPSLAPLRAAAERSREQITAKLDSGEHTLRARVRALYKLWAFGDLPLWVDGVDETARAEALRRRGAARRVIMRDLEERKLLRAELAAIDANLARLDGEAARAREAAATPLPEGSLMRPVAGDVVASFGMLRDERTHVRLLRRGVELGVRTPYVVAAANGQVTYAGPAVGLGIVVIVDHGGGVVSVTGGLASAQFARGDLVAAGDPIGRAAGTRIPFEVRRGGRPVDPFPLLAAK